MGAISRSEREFYCNEAGRKCGQYAESCNDSILGHLRSSTMNPVLAFHHHNYRIVLNEIMHDFVVSAWELQMINLHGVSQESFDLTVDYEVSSRANLEKNLRHPERPGGQSGITVGIGYDCGYPHGPLSGFQSAGLHDHWSFNRGPA